MITTVKKYETASFDVDAQKGFTPLCPNDLPVPGGDEIVPELNAQAVFARLRIGSKDAHPHNPLWLTPSPELITGNIPGVNDKSNIDLYWPQHCTVGSEAMDLLDGLPAPEDYHYFVWKGMERHLHPYGALFHDLHGLLSTGVKEFLNHYNIGTVIVGGLATDYCVRTTCKQLLDEGFRVILNLGACRAVDDKYAAHIIDAMGRSGVEIIGSAAELRND